MYIKYLSSGRVEVKGYFRKNLEEEWKKINEIFISREQFWKFLIE